MGAQVQVLVKKNSYHDSVTLMALSGKVTALSQVQEAVVAMATDMNKELLQSVGMLTAEAASCGANDLVIAIKAASLEACTEGIKAAEEMLVKRKTGKKTDAPRPATIRSAVKETPAANIAIISVPGEHAAREAREALQNGLHVLLFSDNVSIEDEKMLKELAHSHGLLMMGPDCGTAIINHVGLCFANKVRHGNIGIVGASGTGLQEITVLIDRFGSGVSQVIGTGGRDLSEQIGGIMMLDALDALGQDELTEVIVLVSKPPAKSVAEKILDRAKEIEKPVVVCFINGDTAQIEAAGAYAAHSLEDAAWQAVQLAKKEQPLTANQDDATPILAAATKAKLQAGQKYVRGLYCGGTLCDEAQNIVKRSVGTVYSNIAKQEVYRLPDPQESREHTFIDLGDDTFTVGRPHPMIEPSLRLARLVQEAKDPEVAVILLDIVLGYGAHSDPAGVILPAILEARKLAAAEGRYLKMIAYVCGTGSDKQNKVEQEHKLATAGVTLAESNAAAARLAAAIVS